MNISITEIEDKIKHKNALRARFGYLQELQIHDDIVDEEYHIIEQELAVIDKELSNSKRVKEFDKSLDCFLDKYDLDPLKVQNTNFEYLIDRFIVKEEITMWAAKPSTGKSLLSVAVANICLKNNRVERVMYFDADNGMSTLKERNIDTLKLQHGRNFRYFHESQAGKKEMWQIIRKLQRTNLIGTIIIFDSIKNFISGDRDKNKDVSKVMDVLKSLRKQGATVLFLHHTNKPQKDIEELNYAGSSAWEEDTSNAYILKRNEHKQTFIFIPIKKRVGDLKEIAFRYIAEVHAIKEVDIINAQETEQDEIIRNEIIAFLKNASYKPNYSQIMKHLAEVGFSNKDKVNAVIQKGRERYWKTTKVQENNKDLYELMNQNEIGRIGQISPILNDFQSVKTVQVEG